MDNGGTSVTAVNDTETNGCCLSDLKSSIKGAYTCCIDTGLGPYWRCCCNNGNPAKNFRCTGSKGCTGGPNRGFASSKITNCA